MTKLIPLDAAIAAFDYAWTHTAAIAALRAIPAIDPAAIREAALKEAAGLIADMSRIITHTDEDLGTLTGRNLIDPRKAASAIIALIGEKKPCPFCGGEAELLKGEESAYVQCLEVKMHRAMFIDGDNNAASEAIVEWNRRADLAAVPHGEK